MEYKAKLIQKVSDLELASHIMMCVTEGRSHKADKVDTKITEYLNAYNKAMYGNETEGRSKFIDSTVANYCRSVETNLLEALVNTNDLVRMVSNVTDNDVISQAKSEQSLLNYQFSQKISKFSKFEETVKLLVRQQIAVQKIYWDYRSKIIVGDSIFEDGEKAIYKGLDQNEFTDAVIAHKERGEYPVDIITTEEGDLIDVTFVYDNIISEHPNYINVPISNMFWSPASQKISYIDHDCPYVGEVKVMTDSDIRYKLQNDSSYRKMGKDAIDKLLSKTTPPDDNDYSDGEAAMIGSIKKAYQQLETDYSKHATKKQIVVEFHGWFDIDKDGIDELVHVEILNDKVIKLKLNDMPYNMIPYNVAAFDRNPFGVDGEGIPSMLMDIQYIKTAIMRATHDSMAHGALQNYIVEDGMLDKTNLKRFIRRKPGDVVIAKTNIRRAGRLSDRIDTIKSEPIKREYFEVYQMMDQQSQENSGITAYTQGLNSQSLNQTATGVSIITQMSMKILWKYTISMMESFLKPTVLGFRIMNKQLLSDTMFEYNQVPVTITSDDIDLDKDITVNVAIKGFDAEKINQIIQLIQMSPTLIQTGVIDSPAIATLVKELSELWGLREFSSMVKPMNAVTPPVGDGGSTGNTPQSTGLENPGMVTSYNI